jgi:hypothetical protein
METVPVKSAFLRDRLPALMALLSRVLPDRPLALLTVLALVLPALIWPLAAWGQFSQPKVTYERFKWKMYSAPHFDVYYYPEEEAFLEQMVSFAESAYLKLSEDLDHELSVRIPLIYYKTHPEFAQTNITMQELPEAVGAFAEPVQNRMVLPIDGPPDKVYKLLTHELTHIFQYDILYNNKLGRVIRSNPPLWIMEGLASYLAEDEDSFDTMAIRDAVVNSIVPRIEQLGRLSFLTYRFGNDVFSFIEERWGKDGIRNFLFEYRKVLLRNNVPKAIKEAFGLDIEDFNREFQRYLRERYLPYLLEKKEPGDYGREIGFKRPGVFTFAPTVSPGGELVAVLANRKMELDLWVVSGSDGSPIRNVTKGFTNDWQYLVAEVFEGKRDLAWSPAGDEVAVFVRKENRRNLVIFNPRTGKRIKMIPMPGLALQSSPAYSPDGRRIAFAANVAGIYDIYSYDLITKEVVNHTDDPYVDGNPMWSADSTTVLYNRRINAYQKVFEVLVNDPTRKTQLTFGQSSDIMPSYSRDNHRVYYSSDRGDGIFNLFELDLRNGSERRLTDVSTGVFAPVELDTHGDKNVVVFTSYFQGRYRLYRMELGPPEEEIPMIERDLRTEELEPFKPPLQLTLDEDQKKKYKRKYQVESPGLEVGVTDDGTFFGNTYVSFADLMGDTRFIFALSTVANSSNLDFFYTDYSRRTNLIYHVYQHEDFYYTSNVQRVNNPQPGGPAFVSEIVRIEQRFSGGSFNIQYPWNRYYGFDAGVGLSDNKVPTFNAVYDPGLNITFKVIEETKYQALDTSFFFTGNTVRWRSWGPLAGQRFRIGAIYSPELGGSEATVSQYFLDYRKYWKITGNSSFASRTFAIWSNSKSTDFQRVYSIGGLNQLRGAEFRSYVGDRVYFQNLEFRFPLIRDLVFPFGGGLRNIMGVLFMDIGGAYFSGGGYWDTDSRVLVGKVPEGSPQCQETGFIDELQRCREPYDFWNSEGGFLQDGYASWGIGFNFRLSILELNWVFAQRIGMEGDNGPWHSAFYIGNKF